MCQQGKGLPDHRLLTLGLVCCVRVCDRGASPPIRSKSDFGHDTSAQNDNSTRRSVRTSWLAYTSQRICTPHHHHLPPTFLSRQRREYLVLVDFAHLACGTCTRQPSETLCTRSSPHNALDNLFVCSELQQVQSTQFKVARCVHRLCAVRRRRSFALRA